MSILATLEPGYQLTRRPSGVVTRRHLDKDGQPDGYEAVAPVEAFVLAQTVDCEKAAALGWRRFLVPDGLAYVHEDAEQVEALADEVSDVLMAARLRVKGHGLVDLEAI